MKRRSLVLALVMAAFGAWSCGTSNIPHIPKTAAPAPSLSAPEGAVLVVKASRLNLRSCPGTDCRIIAVLPKGEEVIKLGVKRGWLEVRVQAIGKQGWVGARYVAGRDSKPMVSSPSGHPSQKVEEEWAAPKRQTAPQIKEEFAK